MAAADGPEPKELGAPSPRRPNLLLVGRPNSGKSSLFNTLTGGHAREGNFPGITVDVLEEDVLLPGGGRARIVDLPGTYSLEAKVDPDSDEGHARRYLEGAQAGGEDVLIGQVLDSTNLAPSLKLTQELLRLGLPLLLLVTQRDVLEAESRPLDVALLEKTLGVPTLWVSARAPTTRAQVLQALARWATERPRAEVAEPFDAADLAARALGTKVSSRPSGGGGLPRADLSRQSPAVDGRLKLFRRTAALDRYLMHPLLGPLVFLVLMGALFSAVLLVADPATRVIGAGVDALTGLARQALGHGAFTDFLCQGILSGAGTVLQFTPQIVLLTIALEIIEASGYLARGAYLLDRALRVFGLGGRSFVPLLMGHACAIPAISATRIIRDPHQRLRTMLVIPLMTCSARVPAYALLISTFFPAASAWIRGAIFLGLYCVGIFFGAVASLVLGRTRQKNQVVLPLVLELPPYRAPQLLPLTKRAGRTAVRFLKDVGTVIVAMSAVLWILLSIPVVKASAASSTAMPPRTALMERSIAAQVGKAVEPLTRPLGFDWRIDVGLIGAFGARELMVSTMGVIFGVEADGDGVGALPERIRGATLPNGKPAYSAATGLALLAFFVLAAQCMSTLSALRRETRGWKWPLAVVGFTYVAAYLFALAVFQGARVVGLA